ncbi:MAG: ribosome-associated translation inhibitor RaiA [Anaerolineales bacterium]|jgi:putative sigma-54 modulation protein
MTIKVMINVKNMDLNDRLQDYITKKVEKLDRYLDILNEAKVDLQYVKSARNAKDRQVVQLTVRGKGVLLRAEERTDDIFASVDAVMDKVYRQIERYKGRRWRGRGDGRSASDLAMDMSKTPESGTEAEDTIVRRKRFVLTPMDELEAIEQMSLVGHEDFFIFLNAESHSINVLYRRRDGTLGLIEPEID